MTKRYRQRHITVMTGEDSADPVTENSPKDNKKYWEELQTASLKGVRFGVNKTFLKDSIYKLNVEKIVALGGIALSLSLQK
jgi:amidase